MARTQKVTLESPLTGRLTVYQPHRYLTLADGPAYVDTDQLLINLNNEFYTQNIDTIAHEAKTYVGAEATFVEVSLYVAESSATAGPEGRLLVVSIAILVGILLVAIMAVGLTIYTVGNAFHTWQMEKAFPKMFYTMPDPDTGEIYGPWPRETVLTWNASHYPNFWFDPNTTLGFDPSQPDFEDKRDWVLVNTPPGWGEAQEWGGFGELINWIIFGALALGGIYVAVKLLPGFIKRKD